MARTVRDASLETRTARSRLKASGKPYWKIIDPGLHIGYRKGTTGGKWVVRRYIGDGVYSVETIATADDKADADGVAVLDFSQAQQMARQRHTVLTRQAKGLPTDTVGPYTVRACLIDYIRFLERERRTANDARWRAEALILPSMGNIACVDLTADRIRDWLDKAAKTPPRLRTRNGGKQQYSDFDDGDGEQRRKRRATTNRTLTILKAALNRAVREKKLANDDAWRWVQPFQEADAARVRYLTLDECKRLINTIQGEFRELVQAALLTGCRFGELAALVCRDFNPDSGTLHVRTSKSGKGRHVVLNDEGIEFFRRVTAGRTGGELVLRKPAGGHWGKSNQTRPMAEACQRAKIDPPANFHALRHTWASHAVMAGAPLLVVAKNLGHSDTRMVEKHYGHLSADFMAAEIRRAAPRFGFERQNVEPLVI